MTGFQAPNYTQVPNDFFIMARDMDKAELKVVLFLIRETFGYHRETCEVSIRELAIGAGLTARNAYNGGEKAIARGLVEKTVSTTHKTTWRAVVGEDTALYPLRQRTVSLRKSKPPVKEIKEIIKKTTTTTPTAEAIAKFNAFTLYEENIGPLTPLISESITGLISDYTEEWVNRAIQEAAISNVRNIKYISAVCAGYKERGSPDIGRDKTQYGKGKQYGNQQTPKQVQAEPTAADLAIAARIKAQRAVAVQ